MQKIINKNITCLGCNQSKSVDRPSKRKYCSQSCYLSNRKYTPTTETREKLRQRCLENGSIPPSHKGKTYFQIYGDRWLEEINKRREAHLRLWDVKGRRTYKRPKHNRSEYNHWRKAVFERDNYTCQECKDRTRVGHQVTLNAHHIKSFKNFPLLRLEVSNGLTLCHKCHVIHNNIQRKIENCGSYYTDNKIHKE